MNTSTHLNFKGNCREALRFYEQVLGGRIVFAMTYGESPAAAHTPPEMRDQIIHARLDLGTQFLLGCDAPPERYQAPQGFGIMVAVAEPADAERLFQALADDGTVTMPLQETFWAKRFGMCTDRFGTPWMVNCEKPLEAAAGADRRTAA